MEEYLLGGAEAGSHLAIKKLLVQYHRAFAFIS